ncbi:MAG: T9SS type A sorting domain-containing protein [Flavobacteriia bacterium]|nr:T9SS type A sorting domain-containing protein [Flavobacteriia bacterium]
MNKLFIIISLLLFCTAKSAATTTYTVGSSGDNYTTISAAYAACTGATDYVLEIQSDYAYNSETTTGANTITLGVLTNKSTSNTVTIRPASGSTLNFSGTASSIFTLDGANWIIIDGRANGIGASAWTLINSSSTASKRVFTFINDASNNVIKYFTIKGDNSSTSTNTAGLILFSTTTGTTGNDANTIDNCTISENSSNPGCLIQSTGTNAKTNSSNTISNCNLVNATAYFIWIDAYSDNFTFSSNSFYQSANQTLTTNLHFIYINTGSDYAITNNYFGGQSSICGGGAFTLNSSSKVLYCINIANVTGGAIGITGNHFKNMNITSTATGSTTDGTNTSGGFSALFIQTTVTSVCSIGNSSAPNYIGTNTGTTSISLTNNSGSTSTIYLIRLCSTGTGNIIQYNEIGDLDILGTATTLNLYPIYASVIGGTVSITYNIVGTTNLANITSAIPVKFHGIRANGTSTHSITYNTIQNINLSSVSSNTQFYGINLASSTTTVISDISHNTIGSNTNNNIVFAGDGAIKAIYYNPSTTVTSTINYNTIQNFNITGTGTNNSFFGIYPSAGDATINYNTVSNITSTSTETTWGLNGIYANFQSSNIDVTHNTISNLSLTATSSIANLVCGIYSFSGCNIYKNMITGLSNASTNTGAYINGIRHSYSTASNIYNNVILCNNGGNGNSPIIAGIMIGTSNKPANVYHNTVKIYGTATSGSANSYGFYSTLAASYTQIVKDNVFQNLRINSGGTGKHYAEAYTSAGATKTTDYNYLENDASQTNNIGCWAGVDYNFTNFKTNASSSNSKNGTVTLNSVGYPTAGYTGTIQNTGTPIGFITDDYLATSRDLTNPWMGAYEIVTSLPIELLFFNISQTSQNAISIYWKTANEINNDYFVIEKSTDGIHFQTFQIVKGAGNSDHTLSYEIFDQLFTSPILYYRLKQVDLNGISKTSDILSINLNITRDKSYIYPNPSENNEINLYISNKFKNQEFILELFDIFGNNIPFSFQNETSKNSQIIPSHTLNADIYFVKISNSTDSECIKITIN